MTDRRRHGLTIAILVGAASVSIPSAGAGASTDDEATPTVAVTGEPSPGSSVPDDSAPDRTTPDTTEPGGLIGAGEPDSHIDPLYTALAVLGFVGLVGVASWWMVRRDDPDAGPMPPRGDTDPPAGELI